MKTFKELLYEYNDFKYQLKRLDNEKYELEQTGAFPKKTYGQMPSSNSHSSSVENFVFRLIEIEAEKKEIELKILDKRKDLEAYTKTLNRECRLAVECRLFSKKVWDEIANNIPCSRTQAFRYCDAGLKQLLGNEKDK